MVERNCFIVTDWCVVYTKLTKKNVLNNLICKFNAFLYLCIEYNKRGRHEYYDDLLSMKNA